MKLLVVFVALFVASPAIAQQEPAKGQDVIVADLHLPGVADPQTFVANTYAIYQANHDTPPPDQSYVYSPRLKALFDAYDTWQRAHSDDVGSIDFDWWTNAQDYQIRNLAYRVIDEGPEVRWIVARFDNYGRHDEVRFRFVRQGGRWYLDDAMQGTGSGDNGWTLSALLQNPAG